MTDRAAKRRAIADELSATIARLEAQIAKAREGTKSRERLRAQLERARERLPRVIDEAERAEMLAREKKLKRSRIEAANVGYMRRLDALKADAPAIKRQWEKDRAEEEKRLGALRKRLVKRTYKDTKGDASAAGRQEHQWWRRPPRRLEEPVRQPTAAELAEDTAPPPPREGLIPGTYKLVDQTRPGEILDRPRLPKCWTARYVGVRLIEAHRVIARLPASVRPKEYGAAWPEYRHNFGEHVSQVGAGTLFLGRSYTPKGASADEVARMSQAVCWPLQFLSNRPALARDVNLWAAETIVEEFDGRGAPWEGLQIIASALNAAMEPVT